MPNKDLQAYLMPHNSRTRSMKGAKELAEELGLSKSDIRKFGPLAAILTYRMAIKAKVAEILGLPPDPFSPSPPQASICSQCNRALNSGFKFCPSCGNKL